jgi:hypothetical protein
MALDGAPMKSLLPGHMPNLIQLVQGTEQVLPTAMIRYMVVVLACGGRHRFSDLSDHPLHVLMNQEIVMLTLIEETGPRIRRSS